MEEIELWVRLKNIGNILLKFLEKWTVINIGHRSVTFEPLVNLFFLLQALFYLSLRRNNYEF